jgi:NitT/TauT family transport system permease protein
MCMLRCWNVQAGGISDMTGQPARQRPILRAPIGLIPFALICVVWEVLVRVFGVRPIFLPPLEDMPGAIWTMFTQQGIGADISISCFRVIAGFAAAVLLATPLGVMMGYSNRSSRLFAPIIGFIRYMPVPVFIPLCILWFGSGDSEKVIIIFLGTFFQLTLMVQDAANAVRRDFYEAAIMLGAPRPALIFRVLWPAALPQIFDSYRVCIGWAWTYLIVAEIVGASTGIGYYIIKAQRYLMVPQIFAAMTLIGVLGMTTDLALGAMHRWLFPWAERKPSFLT